jgi:hypothetical protein
MAIDAPKDTERNLDGFDLLLLCTTRSLCADNEFVSDLDRFTAMARRKTPGQFERVLVSFCFAWPKSKIDEKNRLWSRKKGNCPRAGNASHIFDTAELATSKKAPKRLSEIAPTKTAK